MSKEKQTHCLRGHERTPENTTKSHGCRICANESNRRHRANNPERFNRSYQKHAEKMLEWNLHNIDSLPKEIVCSKCNNLLSRDCFTPNLRKKRGAAAWCKSCITAKSKAIKKRNQDAGFCRCGNPPKESFKQCVECIQAERVKRIHERNLILDAYGRKCQCPGCDIDIPEFLTIDHIFDDGAQHRRELSTTGNDRSCVGATFYRWLIRNNFPKDRFQLLCMNCNFAKAKGGCPHTRNKEKYDYYRSDRSLQIW